jgi:hypothetical protein
MTKSVHACPACGNPLSVKTCAPNKREFVILYCGHGPCKSKAANDGAIAGTEARAFEELKRAINAEPSPDGMEFTRIEMLNGKPVRCYREK